VLTEKTLEAPVSGQDPDGLPPWAQLIRDKRKAMMPPVSMRKAARLAGMSDSTWLAAENGTRATRGTLASQAILVDVTPKELEDAGRPDAAAALRTLLRQQLDKAGGVPGVLREAAEADARAGLDGLIIQIVQVFADIDRDGRLTAREKQELKREAMDGMVRYVGEQRAHVHTVLRVAQNGV
jgi:hypothetical protein